MKKKHLSTFWGTLAGNREFAKIQSLPVKLATKEVSFREGSVGLKSGRFLNGDFGGCSYWRISATVELSNVPWPVA